MTILSMDSYKVLLEQLPNWPGNYLEIGVYQGDMLRDFALRWPDKTFYGIDPFISDFGTVGHTGVPEGERMEVQREKAKENFMDVPNIIFFEQTSESFSFQNTDEELVKMGVSVVYVDGAHSYEHTLNDLYLSERLIPGNGLIYIDDWDLPEVLEATNDFIPEMKHRIQTHDKHSIFLQP